MEDKLFNYSEEECEKYCLRWGMIINIYNKKDFGNFRLEPYEEGLFPIGEYEETIFRFIYGDNWMYVPELSNQETHNAFQNDKIPFHEYTDCYIKKINQKDVFKKYKTNKRNNMEVFYNRRKVDMIVAKIKVNVESRHICEKLENKENYLRSLLKNKSYNLILDEFKDFISLQLLRDVKKYNIFVPISDRNLATLLLCLIEQGKYYDSDKFLKIREVQEIPLNNELSEIKRIIGICRQLSIVRYDKKDLKLLSSIIDKYESKYPYLLDLYRAKLCIKENNAKSREDFKLIDEFCNQVLKRYPFDGETMAFQARAKMECGEKQEAMNLYKKSIDNTRNGLIWKKVEDEIGISRIEYERKIIEGKVNDN